MKINLSLIIMSSFLLLSPFAVTADEPTAKPNTLDSLPPNIFAGAEALEPLPDPNSMGTPRVDILFVIDSSPAANEPVVPMSPEELKVWKDFKQNVADMVFNKISVRIRFSLNEDSQLMCWDSSVHGSLPLDCEVMITQMFLWIERAEGQDSLTVSNTEPLIQDFIVRQLRQIEAARKVSVLEQFMKDHELSDFAMAATIATPVETQGQPSK